MGMRDDNTFIWPLHGEEPYSILLVVRSSTSFFRYKKIKKEKTCHYKLNKKVTFAKNPVGFSEAVFSLIDPYSLHIKSQ